jgi:hypothetical protein
LRQFFYFLLFLLALAVTGREAPEIAKLADDVSNDGQVVQCQSEVRPPAASQRADLKDGLLSTCSSAFFFENLKNRAPIVPASTGQDLLRLLTLQRK